jgi:hypothetical protein
MGCSHKRSGSRARPLGRPSQGSRAMSDAERARRYRMRQKEKADSQAASSLSRNEVEELRDALRQISYYESEIERWSLLVLQLRESLASEETIQRASDTVIRQIL